MHVSDSMDDSHAVQHLKVCNFGAYASGMMHKYARETDVVMLRCNFGCRMQGAALSFEDRCQSSWSLPTVAASLDQRSNTVKAVKQQ